tara:strand:+ start:3964 stop:4320 length:357 start_codon:yes stop_codon:yes gene_type:complete
MKEEERKDTRKTAKKIIKLAKKHPTWYTDYEVQYAKLIRKSLKKKNYATSETNNSDSQSGGNDGLRGESQQPKQPRQSKREWIAKVLHKAWSLVRFRTGTHDSGDRDYQRTGSSNPSS